MAHLFYSPWSYLGSDFIYVGEMSIYFLSGAPNIQTSYTTLLRPFNSQVWGFLLVSLVSVSITLILINKVHRTLSDDVMGETPFQSMYQEVPDLMPK